MMLCAHPRIHLTHEASFYVWEGLFRLLFAWRRALPGEALVAYYLHTFSFRWLGLDPRAVLRGLPKPLYLGQARELYVAVMREAARAHGKVRFGDKTPSHSGALARIFEDFPDARVVRVVRDPRAVVCSLARMPWGTANRLAASFFCELERVQAARWRGRILEIRLEDLLSQPRGVMERVLGFVGEPWDDAVLAHGDHAPTDLPPVPWFGAARAALGEASAEWRALPAAEVRLLEVLNRSGMRQGGYAPAALAAEPGRLAVLGRWLAGLPGLARTALAFVLHAWAAGARGAAPTPTSRARFRRLNPAAWSALAGFDLPRPPALPDGWEAERARAADTVRFPTQVLDRVFAAARVAGSGAVHLEARYPPGVDPVRLRRAARLLLDAEPILGCRLADAGRQPVWERLDPDGARVLAEVDDPEGWTALQRAPIDLDVGPPIRVGLWRAPDGDRMLFTASHAIADGGDTVAAAARLAEIYRALGTDPDHVPAARPDAPRDLGQIWRQLPWSAVPHLLRNGWRRLAMDRRAFPAHRLRIPLDGRRTETSYLVHTLDRRALHAFAKARGATLDDLLRAAFLRALAAVRPPEGRARLTVATTVDLRRYLPRGAPGICNLSLGQPLTLGTELGADLDATLARVCAARGDLAGEWSALGLELALVPLAGLLPYRALVRITERNAPRIASGDRPPDLFSNLGALPAEAFALHAEPDRVIGLPQFLEPPRWLLAAVGFRDEISLVSAVYPSAAREELVGRLIRHMVDELAAAVAPATPAGAGDRADSAR